MYEQAMGHRVMPDGSIVFDGFSDLLDWARAWQRDQAGGVKRTPLDQSRRGRTWTATDAQEFFEVVPPNSQELLDAIMEHGANKTVVEFCHASGMHIRGVGKRISKLKKDTEAHKAGLPAPCHLEGPPGSRQIVVDPTFADAWEEAFGG